MWNECRIAHKLKGERLVDESKGNLNSMLVTYSHIPKFMKVREE